MKAVTRAISHKLFFPYPTARPGDETVYYCVYLIILETWGLIQEVPIILPLKSY